MVVCFRLHFTKDSTTINTAGATVRQLVTLVFDRMMTDHAANTSVEDRIVDLEQLKASKGTPPKGLYPTAVDAFLLFQVCFIDVIFFSIEFSFSLKPF